MAINLHPDLNLTNFGWSEKSAVKREIRDRISEGIREYEEQLGDFVKECLALINKDDKAFKLCSQFPAVFHRAREINISGKQLGICSDDTFPDNYKDVGDGKLFISSNLSFRLDFNCPMENGKYRLSLRLDLLPESKVEVLKSMFSEYLNKKFELTRELHEFTEQEDSIKTVGRLFRVNPIWYEDLVRSKFPKYLEVEKSTKPVNPESDKEYTKRRKELSENINKEKLEKLKKIIVL